MTDHERALAQQAEEWRAEADRLRQEAEQFCAIAGRRLDAANRADDLADHYERLSGHPTGAGPWSPWHRQQDGAA
jgi:hypothetical protein